MAGIDERWNGMNYIEEINKMLKGANEKELQRAYYFLRGFICTKGDRNDGKQTTEERLTTKSDKKNISMRKR